MSQPSQTSPGELTSDDRLRAFMIGLEMQNVDMLLANARADDMRELGETMAAQIKSAINSVSADQVAKVIRRMQDCLSRCGEDSGPLSPQLVRQWIRDLSEKLP